MNSSNPSMSVFREPQKIASIGNPLEAASSSKPGTMTIQGTVNASSILISLCGAGAIGSWGLISSNPGWMMPATFGGMILALVLSLVIVFKKTAAPFLAPVYAIVEGIFLGAVSLYVAEMLNARNPGVGTTTVLHAVLLTFSVFAAMLIAYKTRLLRPGKVFTACVVAGSGGLMLFYMIAFGASLFGFTGMSSLMSFQNGSPLAVGLSAVAVVLASLMLVLDFRLIEDASKQGLPKYMEWYAGFALLVTLAWLYFEILRLLSKLRSGD